MSTRAVASGSRRSSVHQRRKTRRSDSVWIRVWPRHRPKKADTAARKTSWLAGTTLEAGAGEVVIHHRALPAAMNARPLRAAEERAAVTPRHGLRIRTKLGSGQRRWHGRLFAEHQRGSTARRWTISGPATQSTCARMVCECATLAAMRATSSTWPRVSLLG